MRRQLCRVLSHSESHHSSSLNHCRHANPIQYNVTRTSRSRNRLFFKGLQNHRSEFPMLPNGRPLIGRIRPGPCTTAFRTACGHRELWRWKGTGAAVIEQFQDRIFHRIASPVRRSWRLRRHNPRLSAMFEQRSRASKSSASPSPCPCVPWSTASLASQNGRHRMFGQLLRCWYRQMHERGRRRGRV